MTAPSEPAASPRRVLSPWHAASVVVGMVVGAGIFRTAALPAQGLDSEVVLLSAWGLGGLFALAAALCYAELSTSFPHPGGDYHFIREAFGRTAAFLFAWSRFAVIFTASTAMLAFVAADYLAEAFALGNLQRAGVAAAAIVGVTALNLRGVKAGTQGEMALVGVDVLGLIVLVCAGLVLVATGAPAAAPVPPVTNGVTGFAGAMVFIMLAYGGFNDSATLSAEVRGPKDMTRALVGGMGLVMIAYVLVNWAYLRGLGLSGLAASEAPAAALMAHVFGPVGETVIISLVGVTAITSLNALVIVGGRTLYAAGADEPALGKLAAWDQAKGVPRAAVLVQAGFALLLVLWGAWTRRGFAAMVDYMSPVYWLFLALAGIALVTLRFKRPETPRPYRVPLLPLTGGVFIGGSLFMLWASFAYVGWTGCAVSFGVLAAGLGLRALARALIR